MLIIPRKKSDTKGLACRINPEFVTENLCFLIFF